MRIVLAGCGTVAQAFLRLIEERQQELYAGYGFAPILVAVLDSRGAAVAERGLSIGALLKVKERDGTVAALAEDGLSGVAGEQIIAESGADVLVETTPTNLASPQTGIRHLKAAFRAGMHAVTVNKAPLAVALPGLRELADYNRVLFRFSGTVGAGTPMIAMAEQCGQGDEIVAIRAILNGTTNFVLWRMQTAGEDFDTALAEAVRLGYAETDPSADIDGVDTAIKVVILANVILGLPLTIETLPVAGIRGMTRERIEAAAAQGRCVKLIGEIGQACQVAPAEVELGDPLNVPANLNAAQISLRRAGDVTLIGRGAGGVETATAILRDLLDVWRHIGSRS